MLLNEFKGSYVALVTPFHEGEVDEQSLRKIVNWHIAQGSDGLVPMGTTGESSTVTAAEHKKVVEIVVEEVAGRIPVIAGAGSNNPLEALDYALHAQSVGADAVLCVAGYYNRPSQEGLYQHFKVIHDETTIPMIVYNIPPRAAVDIEPKTMARLSGLPRIVGVKDATGDLARISEERALIDRPFCYFSGDDMTALGYNAMGGTGCISVSANVVPQLCAQLQHACFDKDFALALQLHEKMMKLHQALFFEPSPAGVKYAVSRLGLCGDTVRLPIVPLAPETKLKIQAELDVLR